MEKAEERIENKEKACMVSVERMGSLCKNFYRAVT